jgi:hypothetical protein
MLPSSCPTYVITCSTDDWRAWFEARRINPRVQRGEL